MNSSSGDITDNCDSDDVVFFEGGVVSIKGGVVPVKGEVLVDDDANGCIDVVLFDGDGVLANEYVKLDNEGDGDNALVLWDSVDFGDIEDVFVEDNDDCDDVNVLLVGVVVLFDKAVFSEVLVTDNDDCDSTIFVSCDALVVFVFVDNEGGGIEVKHVGDFDSIAFLDSDVDGCDVLVNFVFVSVFVDNFEDNNVGVSNLGNAGGAKTKLFSIAEDVEFIKSH